MRPLLRIALFPLLLLAAPVSIAMMCVEADPNTVAADSEIAFVGRAISVIPSDYRGNSFCWTSQRGSDCGGKTIVFDVVKQLKGTLSKQVHVLAEDGCYCLGGYFHKDREYLVVAGRNPTTFSADLLAKDVCAGTGPAESAFSKRIINQLSTQPR